ncbi:hypothetical protein [Flavobacterium silvaticum]|uniref:DUF2281 domain-containing protein n=1 Tax=Flavobacterium silvaticum TaxID=1852020 RepID=A0A972FJT7_9FLAO|nr:hypothetical protein [Flavobacterium silvaticum]NMH26515.1 hypothetical protein [Flavobacterium silvaticum]
MTRIQIKNEISKVLDQVPENLLIDILDFLKEVNSDNSVETNLTSNFRKILSEDNELLQKLAQ